jgi:23S rRNA pseudouridine1911/1915/1917 synthase
VKTDLTILYEDNHLLGVLKPGGVLVQGDSTGDVTLLEISKRYIKDKYDKPGKVFLGLVHRLDRPVSGVVLYARTSKAASRLTNEFRLRRVEKVYYAVVLGRVRNEEGELVAFIERVRKSSRITTAESEGAKEAVMTYRVLARNPAMTLLELRPKTGRHHQLRLQLSDMGHPIAGDLKYGAPEPLPDKTIALHAGRLTVKHPTKDEVVRLAAPPPRSFPWNTFDLDPSGLTG